MNRLLQIRTTALRSSPRLLNRCTRSFTSDTYPNPPMLAQLRSDLKEALTLKNTTKLNVLRGILTDVTYSAKINRAITQDSQLIAILKQRLRKCEAATTEFAAAGRDDLKAKEDAEISVLRGYLDGIEKVPEEDIRKAALEALDILRITGEKIQTYGVIKLLTGAKGPFYGKYVDMPSLTGIIRELLQVPEKPSDEENPVTVEASASGTPVTEKPSKDEIPVTAEASANGNSVTEKPSEDEIPVAAEASANGNPVTEKPNA